MSSIHHTNLTEWSESSMGKVGMMHHGLFSLTLVLNAFCLMLLFFTAGLARGENLPESKRYAWISWGDIMWLYGPGTDPAMDTPEALEKTIKHWKKRGFSGVHLRTDLQQIAPFIQHHPKKDLQPSAAVLLKSVDDVMASFDIHATGQEVSEAMGFEFWAWHPHLYSDGAPVDAGAPGHGRNWPWPYEATYLHEHPEALTVDREGNKYWMVREYAYPGARSSKVEEFVHMAKAFGLRRFVADMRSEANQMQDPADKADRFGFNEPVVQDMKKLYGVDILTDPRFDVDAPGFDLHDPMVENWRALRGSYLTQFFRELRKALREVDPNIKLAVTVSGEHIGPPLGNWKLDWRTWVDEGLVDEIVAPASFEATHDHESGKRGYLTNLNAGQSTLALATIVDYIKQSRHPEIKLIATGAPSYFYPLPPEGAEGWRCNMFYDAYHLAWFQRWEQWKRDLHDFGHIKFIEQNFDGFPTDNNGVGGGWGDGRYFPDLRASPGFWQTLGDGSDEKPVAQGSVRHGDKGLAMKLTASAQGDSSLLGRHFSAPDRSTYTACLDTAITNGTCDFEFWLFRASEQSALIAYLQGDGNETDVGVKVSPQTGQIAYSRHGEWVETASTLPVGEWQKVRLRVDFDHANYEVSVGSNGRNVVAGDIPYVIPKNRVIEEIGVHQPIEVPAWKFFNRTLFIPQGSPGSVTYLDDVAVDWKATTYYEQPGERTVWAENFESFSPGQTPFIKSKQDKLDPWFIDNHTSFGDGVNCLHSRGGEELVFGSQEQAPSLDSSKITTIDFDVFIRSDKDFAYIVSNPLTKSPSRTVIGLNSKADPANPWVSLKAGDGKWHYWDGDKFTESKTPIVYDVWNHVQLAIDSLKGTYQIVVQPVGEMPILVGRGALGHRIQSPEALVFSIAPSNDPGHISCYDNLVLTGPDEK